ncbi:C40 family peptidase [Pseudonocardia sp. T1-2H]|uniref:C40 family peptidase n=1 Tax=Pseudonocardia sp. T1-2H TaxID=3128899 RepID=UPI003101A43C
MSSLRPALALRTATVAVLTTATAALFTLVPATAATAPAASATTAVTTPVTAPVRNVANSSSAFASPAAAVAAAKTGASPAAARASAVQKALGKVGAPYRWGASGPSAFDCSGLTSWAFKQAGISLPRTSRAQSRVGTPVSKANLQPGDLVFFYKPVSHVAIYIGNGKVVHASRAGQPVKISNLNRMPFNSARRV